jgi:hypothetical protein
MTQHPLEGLLYSQDCLADVCAERSLTFSEYAHMNEFHGNAATLRRYAGLSADPLPFAIEHAIPYDLDAAYDYDLHSGLPSFLAVHQRSAELYRQGDIRQSVPIGFSFLYATQLFHQLHPQAAEHPRSGTLVFPDKSTLLMDTDFDRAAFAARLVGLPAEYQPVVVCIYWKDYVRGAHKPFAEAGLPIVSAGHTLDEDFPLRLYDLCRRFRYSCANDIAGSFTLSVLAGCHFFHLPSGQLTQTKHGLTEQFEQDPTLLKPMKQACLLASPFPPGDPAEQRRLAAEQAGVKHQRDASFLRRCFHEARQALLARQQPGILNLPEKSGWRGMLSLFPTGIDSDGCAKEVASLFIADGSRIGKLRVKLSVFDASTTITVSRGHRKLTELSGQRSHTVTVDIAHGEQAQRIVFVSSKRSVISAEDPRERSFFIRQVELRAPKPSQKRRPSAITRIIRKLRHAIQ